MKIRQLCLAMLAATTMWSCAKDDVVKDNDLGEGTKAVNVKIVNPTTKAIQTPTGGTNGATQAITVKSITLRLTGEFVNSDKTVDVATFTTGEDAVTDALAAANAHIFYDVKSITEFNVYINYDKVTGADTDHATTVSAQTAKGIDVSCHAVATTSDFTLKTTTTHEEQNYDVYSATLQPAPCVARLEVSGVKVVVKPAEGKETSKYEALNFSGVVLNNYYEGGDIKAKVATQTEGTLNNENGEGMPSLQYLKKLKAYSLCDFQETLTPINVEMGSETSIKIDGCYAYNFFTSTAGNPVLTFAFEGCIFADKNTTQVKEQYAVVKNYKDAEGKAVTFAAGNIYRIKSVEIGMENDINVATSVMAVTAIVEVQPWTIKDISVEF